MNEQLKTTCLILITITIIVAGLVYAREMNSKRKYFLRQEIEKLDLEWHDCISSCWRIFRSFTDNEYGASCYDDCWSTYDEEIDNL